MLLVSSISIPIFSKIRGYLVTNRVVAPEGKKAIICLNAAWRRHDRILVVWIAAKVRTEIIIGLNVETYRDDRVPNVETYRDDRVPNVEWYRDDRNLGVWIAANVCSEEIIGLNAEWYRDVCLSCERILGVLEKMVIFGLKMSRLLRRQDRMNKKFVLRL